MAEKTHRRLALPKDTQLELLAELRVRTTGRDHSRERIIQEARIIMSTSAGLINLHADGSFRLSASIPEMLQRLEQRMLGLLEEILNLQGQQLADEWTAQWGWAKSN
ncbi:uncharacterized protein N7479_000487 [Penicillium vulpinum]|uniref:Uncharacterized protein n=1 Tax=Penicillium vulpinum TaxID=29845 RepID=A0A1V6S4U3_9EURO|nr:uncharacterized protein N7479_000487 [Penicillium vulpinum]KAJ5970569.1 hypothetical protein N7479_000487 [Penicillium vulpinum]OQE09075.1 hypothetical protein PENVUL_c007G01430 [Penicillium vulpinum]